MDIDGTIDRIVELLTAADLTRAQPELSRLASVPGREKTAVYEAIVARVDHPHPSVGAYLALVGGALIEAGLDARPLARAIVAPLRRAVADAGRFHRALEDAPEASAREPSESLGERSIARAELERITARDPRAANAFHALDVWYRPAVAAWSRDVATLAVARADEVRSPLAELSVVSQGAHWLSMLLAATLGERFVVLIPELDTAHSMTLEGVVDAGQLTILLSEALADPLRRIGASGPAPARALAIARGEGPQQSDASYAATFSLYPWQAMNPQTGLPEDGRFTWHAPGGTGQHSLPADFLPIAIEPVGDARVLVLVGPNAPRRFRLTRELAASRVFAGLFARLADVRRLPETEAREWFDAVRRASSS